MTQIQWPDTNFRYLEGIKHVHSYSIRSLIRQVAANSTAKTFKSLTNINRFAVVIIKSIDAPLAAANSVPIIIKAVEE